MNTIRRKWSVIAVTGLIVLSMGCLFPAAGAKPTVTPEASAAPLPTLPPAVETLSSAVSTPTPASGLDPALQTATAQFGAVETLVSASGLPTGTAQSAMIATLLASMNGGASPTPGPSAGGGANSGGNSSGGSSGGNGSGNGSGSGSGSGSSGGNGTDSSTATATEPPPSPSGGPYVVKQIQTLGGEVLSGFACDVARPFSVTAAAPKVTFVFLFAPLDEKHGNVSYRYSIPSAGESHDASGTYTLSPLDKSGTLQLSLAVSDHVVFKGFDGNIPNRYKFNLVRVEGTSPCP